MLYIEQFPIKVLFYPLTYRRFCRVPFNISPAYISTWIRFCCPISPMYEKKCRPTKLAQIRACISRSTANGAAACVVNYRSGWSIQHNWWVRVCLHGGCELSRGTQQSSSGCLPMLSEPIFFILVHETLIGLGDACPSSWSRKINLRRACEVWLGICCKRKNAFTFWGSAVITNS